jgi:hypothetical protein
MTSEVRQNPIEKTHDGGQSVDSIEAASSGAAWTNRTWWYARFIAGPLLVAVLILLGFSIWSVWRYGNVSDGIAFLDGFVVIAAKPTLELGSVPVGTEAKGVFVLKNLTDEPISLVGASPDCSCMIMSDFPIRIEPHGTATFDVRFTPRAREAGRTVTHRILLYLNVDSPTITLALSAHALPVDRTRKDATTQNTRNATNVAHVGS